MNIINRAAVYAGFLLLSTASLAVANEKFPIPENTINHTDASYPGRTVDVIGIKPGASGEEALKILQEHREGRNVNYSESNFGTRNVSSDYFRTAYYSWNRDVENITILLTSPSSGGKVYSVARQLNFRRDDRPTLEDMTASLIEKYGEPSAEKTKNSSNKTLYWYLGGDEKCTSKKEFNVCNSPIYVSFDSNINKMAYSPAKLEEYREQAASGADTIIIARMHSFDNDGRIQELLVSIVEPKRAFETAEVDVKLVDEAEKVFNNRTVATPKL